LARRVAGETLEATRGLKLSTDEVESNVKLAREVVLGALSECGGVASKEKSRTEVGVYATASGKWCARISYHGNQFLGTYGTREHASLARRVAGESLEATSGLQLSTDEVESNVKLAREAALGALSECGGIANADVLDDSKKTTRNVSRFPVAKTHAPPKDSDAKPQINGVHVQPSGNWKVELSYYNKRRCLGTYSTWEHAALVSRIAREKLDATRGLDLSPDKIQLNVKHAKVAALSALSKSKDESPGKWRVEIDYQGVNHYIGAFKTRAQARLVDKIARRELETTCNLQLTSDEIESYVELAGKVACKALRK